MSKSKLGLIAGLVIIYGCFWIWYGGNGDQISKAEGELLLARVEATYGDSTTPEPKNSLRKNLPEMIRNDDGKEFYAINLETITPGKKAREEENKYASIILPQLLKRAGHPVLISETAGLMLGDYGRNVDQVVIVRHRSLRDMIEMSLEPSMKQGWVHKYGSVDNAEVFITRASIAIADLRLILGLLVMLIGFFGVGFINWKQRRAQDPELQP